MDLNARYALMSQKSFEMFTRQLIALPGGEMALLYLEKFMEPAGESGVYWPTIQEIVTQYNAQFAPATSATETAPVKEKVMEVINAVPVNPPKKRGRRPKALHEIAENDVNGDNEEEVDINKPLFGGTNEGK